MFELAVGDWFARTHGSHSVQNGHDVIRRLHQRQDGDDERGSETPRDGNQHPESKVGLREDTGGNTQQGPDEDKDQSQHVSASSNPDVSTLQLGGILFFGAQAAQIFLHKLDVGVELCEVVVLRVNEHGVDEMNDSAHANGDQVSGEHDLVGTESSDGDLSGLDLSCDQPANHSEDKTEPGCDDSTGSRCLLPGHHVPKRNDSTSDYDSHEEVDPSQVQAHLV
mmetsp:Transcript_1727/g.2334  ORF Transcript_1727/g.2334 Transcript_1727/m.2334 type:complete len:223 (+) Transcript_1727:385-1053(+)